MRKTIVISVIFFLPLSLSFAQTEVTGEAELAAEILALSDEYEAESVMEHLAELTEKPVMLNSGDEEEIARLFFLTDFQVKVLADHVIRNGNIASIYEVALLPGFDRNTAKLLSPYIILEAVPEKSGRNGGTTTIMGTAMIKLPSEDFKETGIRSIVRLRHIGSKLSYGFTAENDPGEPFTFDRAYGPDFLSGHLMYQGKGFINRVIVGDYSLRFGEGLVFNNSAWQGSWLTSLSFMTGRAHAATYTSTEENNFFRGAAIILGSMINGATIFVSSNAIDGRLDYDPFDGSQYITNLVRGGLHDTESGQSARNSLTERLAGVHLSAGFGSVRSGFTASFTHFSLPFQPDSSNGEQFFDFRGERLVNIGADFKAGTGKLLFFCEAGYSFPGSWAATGGIRAAPSNRVTINLMARHFSPGYHSFHSNAFGVGTTDSNETGIAGSIHLEAARHLFLSGGADLYHIPWLRYRSSAPSTGSRIEIKGEFVPHDNLSLRLSWITTDCEYDLHDDTGVAATVRQRREQVTVMAVYTPVENIRLTTRAGYCRIAEAEEHGYMLCQDIHLSVRHLPLRFWLRYSLFSTDSYNTRLYAWENDMLYTFSIPALYGEGSRACMMVSWKPFGGFEVRAKYAVMTGEINMVREVKQEVRVQCRIVF